MVCKWFASISQTLHKLVCQQVIKYKWFRNALVNKYLLYKYVLPKALQVPQLAKIYYLRLSFYYITLANDLLASGRRILEEKRHRIPDWRLELQQSSTLYALPCDASISIIFSHQVLFCGNFQLPHTNKQFHFRVPQYV